MDKMYKFWVLVGLSVVGIFASLWWSRTPSAGSTIVLRCANWGDAEETQILPRIFEEFKKTHPGVDVQLYRAPWADYISKILTLFSAGMAPDVMAIDGEQFPVFSSKGIYLALDPYLEKDKSVKLSEFYPESLESFRSEGRLYGLPRDIAPVAVIYYNKKEFDEAGLPYPKDDWTYEQFLKTAEKLTKKDKTGRTIQFGFVDDFPNWEAWVYAFGGKLVDDVKHPARCLLDSPEAAAGVQFRGDMINRYKVLPSSANLTAMGGLGNSDLFMNGLASMFFSGIWLTPQLRHIENFDWDVVEFPKGPQGRRLFYLGPTAYGVIRTTKYPQLSYELVTFLSGRTAQALMAQTGLTQPANEVLAKTSAFLDHQRPRSKGFLVNAVHHGTFHPFDVDSHEWLDMVGSAMDPVWEGKKTAKEALAQVTAQINRKFYHIKGN